MWWNLCGGPSSLQWINFWSSFHQAHPLDHMKVRHWSATNIRNYCLLCSCAACQPSDRYVFVNSNRSAGWTWDDFHFFLQQQRSPPIYNNNRYFYWFVKGLFSSKLRICRSYRYSRQSVNMSSEMLCVNARNSNSTRSDSLKLNETPIVCELSANEQVRRFRLDSKCKSDYVRVSVLFDLFDETMIMSLEMQFVQTVRCQLSAC